MQGALGAVAVLALWTGIGAMLPDAEEGDPHAPPLWATDYIPVSPMVGPAPVRAGFFDLSYVDLHNEATVNHWEWDFGDGSPTLVCFGSQCVPRYQVIHTYSAPGAYDVQLLTGGTMEGTVHRPSLVRAYDPSEIPSDIVGFWLRDGYYLLFSPSMEWPSLSAAAEAIGVRAILVLGDSQVERLPAETEDLIGRLHGLPWVVALVASEMPR